MLSAEMMQFDAQNAELQQMWHIRDQTLWSRTPSDMPISTSSDDGPQVPLPLKEALTKMSDSLPPRFNDYSLCNQFRMAASEPLFLYQNKWIVSNQFCVSMHECQVQAMRNEAEKRRLLESAVWMKHSVDVQQQENAEKDREICELKAEKQSVIFENESVKAENDDLKAENECMKATMEEMYRLLLKSGIPFPD